VLKVKMRVIKVGDIDCGIVSNGFGRMLYERIEYALVGNCGTPTQC